MTWTGFFNHATVPSLAGGADDSNFPCYVNITDPRLRLIANGGQVNDGTKDIAIYSDVGTFTSLMVFERVFYDGVNGIFRAWVKVPVYSSSVVKRFYTCFGNSAVVTDQSNPTGVWDANFIGVYHGGDGTTISLNDSTSNANHMTNVGGVTAGTSNVGGGFVLTGANYLLRTSSPVTAIPVTISAAFNITTAGNSTIAGLDPSASAGVGVELQTRGLGIVRLSESGGGGTVNFDSSGASIYTAGVLSHADGVFNTVADRTSYVNGNAGQNSTTATSAPFVFDRTIIGARIIGGVFGNFFIGTIAEVRYSNIARASSWNIKTDNSVNSPSTFITTSAAINVPVVRSCTVRGFTANYRLQFPTGTMPVKGWPVIEVWHGSGSSGTDNNLQLGDSLAPTFIKNSLTNNCIILYPQYHTGGDGNGNGIAQDIAQIMLDLLSVVDNLQYDKDRVYLIGFSLGGNIAMDNIAGYQRRKKPLFAAAVIISSNVNPARINSFYTTLPGQAAVDYPTAWTQGMDYVGSICKMIQLPMMQHQGDADNAATGYPTAGYQFYKEVGPLHPAHFGDDLLYSYTNYAGQDHTGTKDTVALTYDALDGTVTGLNWLLNNVRNIIKNGKRGARKRG